MANFEDFNIVLDIVAKYVFGSYPMFASLVIGAVFISILIKGIDLKYAVLFIIPLVGAFVGIGWFGISESYQWITNFALILGSFIYAFAIMKLTT